MAEHKRITRCAGFIVVGFVAACASGGATSASQGSAGHARDTATVSAADIQQTPTGDPLQLLMARSPGVWVGRSSSGGIAIRIRGASSSAGDPLYIVDGSPFQPAQDGTLTGINPYDIESIKVLKNAADLTMYGSRGANGVIIIKTKRKSH